MKVCGCFFIHVVVLYRDGGRDESWGWGDKIYRVSGAEILSRRDLSRVPNSRFWPCHPACLKQRQKWRRGEKIKTIIGMMTKASRGHGSYGVSAY